MRDAFVPLSLFLLPFSPPLSFFSRARRSAPAFRALRPACDQHKSFSGHDPESDNDTDPVLDADVTLTQAPAGYDSDTADSDIAPPALPLAT